MSRFSPLFKPFAGAGLLALTMISATAGAAEQMTASAAECGKLGAEISKTYEEMKAAEEKKKTAYKAVIPFAVVGRYTSAKVNANQADKKLDALHAKFHEMGCTSLAS